MWGEAIRVTEFVQQNPVDGAPATEDTEVSVAYDSTNLYFGFYAHYSDVGLVRANRSDRDQLGQDDTISVYFDRFLDQQRAYVFTVNGYGVSDPAFGRTAQFLIGRLRYDLYAGSYIGALFTDREFINSYSRVRAVDGRFRLGRTNNLEFRAAQSSRRQQDDQELSGATYDFGFNHNGRNLDLTVRHDSVEPGFGTATGFVRRTDTRRTRGNVQYSWWPEGWILNWGPGLDYERNYDFDGVLADEVIGVGVNFQFARYIRFNVDGSRELERYRGIDFWKWRHQMFGQVGTSRRFSVGGGFNWGDQIRFSSSPFLGRSTGGRLFLNLLPFSRLRANVNVDFSRLVDPRDSSEVFDVKIFRSQTTYQFTERLLLRNILEYNTFDRTFDANILVTYRVNAGTVFFVGYDDHYQQGHRLDEARFPTDEFR